MEPRITPEQAVRRERTLLRALFMSSWGPLTTGVAVLMSRSTTQLADFIRRSVDLVALFIAWFTYRRIRRQPEITAEERARLERITSRCVAVALTLSGLVLGGLLLWRGTGFELGGRVGVGIFAAVSGASVNGWFWWRYASYNREQRDAILLAQIRLHRTKAIVDVSVLVALLAVAIDPAHTLTRLLDLGVSAIVAGYLVWSGLSTRQQNSSDRISVTPTMTAE